MPLLAAFFETVFVFLCQFLMRWVSIEKAAKLAQATTFIGAILVIWGLFMNCVSGVCGSTIAGMGGGGTWGKWFSIGLGVVFNTKTYTIMSCYLSVWLACQLYIFKKRIWGNFF